MKKICSFVFLSLLVSTCISFAADNSASSPDLLCNSECDVLSPEMMRRLGKRPKTGGGETDGLELVDRRSVTCEATGGATAGAADQEGSDDDLEDFLKGLGLGSEPSEQTGNSSASTFARMKRGAFLKLPSAREEEYYGHEEGNGPSTIYFREKTPTKEKVTTVLPHLIKGRDSETVLRLNNLIDSLFKHSPTRLNGDYFNDFAQELDSCKTLFDQNEFLGTKEEQLKLWLDQEDAKANITEYKFSFKGEIREKNEAYDSLVLLVPRNDLAEGRLEIILDLLYPKDGGFPKKEVLDDIATQLINARADVTKENYLLTLERRLKDLPEDMD